MRIDIVTPEHLHEFRIELLKEIDRIVAPKVEKPKKWIKAMEVRKLLKISPGTLQTLRENGTFRFTKIGGIIFYDHDHIQKVMKDNVREAKSTDRLGIRKA